MNDMFSDTLYAGLYVARDAEVTFSDISLQVDQPPQGLQVSAAKSQYLLNQPLDLSTLTVTAQVYGTGESVVLQPNEYMVTGYNPDQLGTQTVTVSYKGAEAYFDVTVIKLDVVDMRVTYLPAKTVYYVGDAFDSAGMVVTGDYNNGVTAEITPDKYALSITGATVTDAVYTFEIPGQQMVTVKSLETPTKTATFPVEVKADTLTGLEIAKTPAKTSYFLDEILTMDGMILYAQYSNGSKVRIMDGEYSVSGPDMSIAGTYNVIVSFRGMQTTFPITVKAKSVTGLEVKTYPKTTYKVEEDFDPIGLKVAKVYDNGDRETLILGKDYILDTTAYDKTKAGIYELPITPVVEGPAPTVLKVAVRNDQAPVWKSIEFGQSTSATKNTVTVKENDTVEIVALEGAGKVTGDHDGISFYYTELDAENDNFELSATINVKVYAKTPHDGQESFGIMARDAIGTAKDSSVFASNIAAIGGYSGGTGNANGTQLFVRTGVTSPDGAGSKGIQKIMLNNARPGPDNTPYTLTLGKTNSGFYGKIGDGKSEMFFEPDILKVQDSKMYVGFYAARLATIEVSNIQLKVTSAAADAPKVEAPAQPIEPNFDLVSLSRASTADYDLRVLANVDGTLTVRKGQEEIRQDAPVQAGAQTVVPVTLVNGENTFSITFLPDNTQFLTSESKIVKNFTVTLKSFGNGNDLIVTPQGTAQGEGTAESPLDLDTAIDFVQPGQTIVLQEGVYKRSSPLFINKYNDGTADAMKYLVAAPGTRPVIDFDEKSEGVVLGGNYWHVKGIDFARSAANTKGFTVGGSYNIVEDSRFYENGDTGLQISRTDGSDNKADWPSYNLILNSTSFDNKDPSQNNADGFAAKLTVGEGNVFRGCIAHNNIDDGWDLYTKAGTGAIGAVIIEDSIAYNNGTLTNGEVGKGDKNGFKLGGEGIHVPHIIRNSIAFGNGAYGYTSNSNPGLIVENNIGFDNARGNLNLSTYTGITPDFQLKGFVSYQKSYTAADTYPATLASDSNYLFNGSKSANKSGVALSDSNFKSLTPVVPSRDAQGNIVLGDFLKFVAPVPSTPEEPSTPENPSTPGNPSTPSVPGPTQPAEPKTVLEGPNGLQLTKESVPYLSGYEDGTVRPDNRITREEVLSLFYGLLVNTDKGQTTGAASFKDLSSSGWSTPAIQYFLQKGLVNGYEDGTFRPAAPMTRAELVTILVQFLPKTAVQGTVGFSDSGNHWAKAAIEQAAAAGWVNGYEDGSFRPDQSITRAETIVLLNRALGRTPNPEQLAGKKGFTDLDSGHWAYYHLLESSK
ncbi:bacterial Ig-like domain-containing protein [Paenibacillus sp. YN15]|uniref:bacterial Ig-like domain-containing protein n=1 Tax=Paenibacillus sp. YN15 TaxID=1742774 RepID=UPI0015EC9DB3|nr:bacterial Ig-like domain-containing protein [Paenibacillus sp. YN15]